LPKLPLFAPATCVVAYLRADDAGPLILAGALDQLGVQANVRVEEGYVSKNSVIMLALAIFAGLVTIGAAGIATGLAQADAEPDLRTLTAVGAPPRVRRTLSGFQCGVVAAMGVVLGSAAGTLPAVGLRKAEERQALKMYHQSLDHGWGLSSVRAACPAPVCPQGPGTS
jgi:putative ABC transport system permease protein